MNANGLDDEEIRRATELKITAKWIGIALATGLAFVAFRHFVSYWGLDGGHREAKGNALAALLWSAAWFSTGFLFGFLFGVPKALQDQTTAGASSNGASAGDVNRVPGKASVYRSRPNTNLEEISDWLTKLLVGATITQLGKIPGLIMSAGAAMAPGIGDVPSVAAAILIYFSTLGFFAGYVITRLFFSGAFVRSDRGLEPPSRQEIEAMRNAVPTSDGETATPSESVVATAERMSHVPLTDKLTASQALAVARGALVTSDINRAVQAAAMAAGKAPDDPDAQISYAYSLYKASGQSPAVLEQLERAHSAVLKTSDASMREDIYNSLIYIGLYQAAPAGFRKAIEWGEEFLSSSRPRGSSFWVNIACAYGQQYAALKAQPNPDQTKLEETRRKVIEFVTQCDSDPAAQARLRDLADPFDADADLAAVVADTPALKLKLTPQES